MIWIRTTFSTNEIYDQEEFANAEKMIDIINYVCHDIYMLLLILKVVIIPINGLNTFY